MWRFCARDEYYKGQRFYNTAHNEYNTIVLYSVLYTYNRTIEASLMPFQTRPLSEARCAGAGRRGRRDANTTCAATGRG